MKRKVLALLLTVVMIVPAVAMVANAENHAYFNYAYNAYNGTTATYTDSTGMYGLVASAVNAGDVGGTGYVGANSFFAGQAAWSTAGISGGQINDYALVLNDPAYKLASSVILNTQEDLDLAGAYANTNGVAPKMQIVTDYRNKIDGSRVVYTPLGLSGGAYCGYVNGYGATAHSFAFSTDPIPAVTAENTDPNTGYVVENGAIQNGFAITLSSNGVVNNSTVSYNGGTTVERAIVATNYYAAIFEDGEIIAYAEGDIDNSTNPTYLYMGVENVGSFVSSLWNQFTFENGGLNFRFGDTLEGNAKTLTFDSTTSGTGDWSNITRLSEKQAFYQGMMLSSPALTTNDANPNYANYPWAASSFILRTFGQKNEKVNGAWIWNDLTLDRIAPTNFGAKYSAISVDSGSDKWLREIDTNGDGIAEYEYYKTKANIGADGYSASRRVDLGDGKGQAIRVKFTTNVDVLTLDQPIVSVCEDTMIGAPVYELKIHRFFLAVRKGGNPQVNIGALPTGSTTATVKIFEEGQQVGKIWTRGYSDVANYSIFLYNISNLDQTYKFDQYITFDANGVYSNERLNRTSTLSWNGITVEDEK